MKFTTAIALLAAASASPALSQVFTITGTRIPSDAVHVATLVKDGITIITGTRLPTADVAAADLPIPLTSAHTPTTFETRVAATLPPARASSVPVAVTEAPAPVSSAEPPTASGAPVAARAAENVFIEKRCLALGSECGNNGVYTDCCDDQLCAENHGTGSLTCGGVSV